MSGNASLRADSGMFTQFDNKGSKRLNWDYLPLDVMRKRSGSG